MAKLFFRGGVTGVVLRLNLLDSSVTTGAGKTGLTNASAGLRVSAVADVEAAATAYTSAGSTVDAVTTLGTFAAPASGHCRFQEVDATNHPGLYEVQLADARWAIAGARSVEVCVQATGAAPARETVQLLGPNGADLSSVPVVDVSYSGGVSVSSNDGTAQGGTANTITLAASASPASGLYVGRVVTIVGGTGAGQSAVITAYNGPGRVATVHRNWVVTPDATSQYLLDNVQDPVGLLLPAVVCDGKSWQQWLQVVGAATAGVCAGVGTGIETYKGLDGVTTHVVATIDVNFNRIAVNYF